MTKISILDRLSLSPSFDLNLGRHEHEVQSFDTTDSSQVSEHIGASEIAILSKVAIGAADLLECNKLKHIAVAATGYNIVDIPACQEHGVSVSHIPGYAATTVAEHVLACMLILKRQILDSRQNVIAGDWQKSKGFCLFGKPFSNLEGATVGILGLGEIGQKVAELVRPFGVNVIYTSRKTKNHWAKRVTLNELLEKSDIVSLHCSLNKDTHNIIGGSELELMKPSAILINTSRGGLVDETAVAEKLNAGLLGAAAFDVLAEEPPKSNSPLLEIAEMSNVIITPHCSWTSSQALQHLETVLNNNITAYLDGSPLNLVA